MMADPTLTNIIGRMTMFPYSCGCNMNATLKTNTIRGSYTIDQILDKSGAHWPFSITILIVLFLEPKF